MKRILCVRLPNWPLQRLVVSLQSERRVGQAGSPSRDSLSYPTILLYARDPRRGECIVTCSRAAHACGQVRCGADDYVIPNRRPASVRREERSNKIVLETVLRVAERVE